MLIAAKDNGFPKVITGIRHCGKSYLFNKIYKQYLIDNGISDSNIIDIDLTKVSNTYYRDPIYLYNKNKNLCVDLLALSKLIKLKKLRINYGYFTFKQFAWLKSKLLHNIGIVPLHKWENGEDEILWSVIGYKKLTVKNYEIARKYKIHYYALVIKYQNRENHPIDDEK